MLGRIQKLFKGNFFSLSVLKAFGVPEHNFVIPLQWSNDSMAMQVIPHTQTKALYVSIAWALRTSTEAVQQAFADLLVIPPIYQKEGFSFTYPLLELLIIVNSSWRDD